MRATPRSRAQAIVYSHIDRLPAELAAQPGKLGKAIALRVLQAMKLAISPRCRNIEGTAADVIAALASRWAGPIPSDPTYRATRKALARLAEVTPLVERRGRRWAILIGDYARLDDPTDRRIGALQVAANDRILPYSACNADTDSAPHGRMLLNMVGASEAIQPVTRSWTTKERARATSLVGSVGRAAWLRQADTLGRWAAIAARLISAEPRIYRGTANGVAVALLSSVREAALPGQRRKWAQRPYTARERIGIARALKRLAECRLVTERAGEWSVPRHLTIAGDDESIVAEIEAGRRSDARFPPWDSRWTERPRPSAELREGFEGARAGAPSNDQWSGSPGHLRRVEPVHVELEDASPFLVELGLHPGELGPLELLDELGVPPEEHNVGAAVRSAHRSEARSFIVIESDPQRAAHHAVEHAALYPDHDVPPFIGVGTDDELGALSTTERKPELEFLPTLDRRGVRSAAHLVLDDAVDPRRTCCGRHNVPAHGLVGLYLPLVWRRHLLLTRLRATRSPCTAGVAENGAHASEQHHGKEHHDERKAER